MLTRSDGGAGEEIIPFSQWSFSERSYVQYLTDVLGVHHVLEQALSEGTVVHGPDHYGRLRRLGIGWTRTALKQGRHASSAVPAALDPSTCLLNGGSWSCGFYPGQVALPPLCRLSGQQRGTDHVL